MNGEKTAVGLDGAGIVCLGIGVGLLQGGEYVVGGALVVVGAGLLYIKYHIRSNQ